MRIWRFQMHVIKGFLWNLLSFILFSLIDVMIKWAQPHVSLIVDAWKRKKDFILVKGQKKKKCFFIFLFLFPSLDFPKHAFPFFFFLAFSLFLVECHHTYWPLLDSKPKRVINVFLVLFSWDKSCVRGNYSSQNYQKK